MQINFVFLSVKETMEKLTWLASERRLCGEGDSEEDNSPTSPTSPNSPVSQNSQEENSEEEEEGAVKGEEMELGDGGASKLPEGDIPQEEDGPPQASGKGAGRGRGEFRSPFMSLCLCLLVSIAALGLWTVMVTVPVYLISVVYKNNNRAVSDIFTSYCILPHGLTQWILSCRPCFFFKKKKKTETKRNIVTVK